MTSSTRDYFYNSGFDVWAFVSNVFNANRLDTVSVFVCVEESEL